jgi:hypothetical protein
MMGGNADTRPREERLRGKMGACRSRLGDWIKRDEESGIGKTRPCVFSMGDGNTIRHDMMDGWMNGLFFVVVFLSWMFIYVILDMRIGFLGIDCPVP